MLHKAELEKVVFATLSKTCTPMHSSPFHTFTACCHSRICSGPISLKSCLSKALLHFYSSCATRFLCALGNLLQLTSTNTTQTRLYLPQKGKGVVCYFCCSIQQLQLLYFSSEEKNEKRPEQSTMQSLMSFKRKV